MNMPTRPDGTLADLDGHTHGGRYHSHIGGSQPHDHTEPPQPPRRRGGAVPGFIIAVIGAAILWFPWFGGGAYSVSYAHGVCHSTVGQVAQLFSGQAVRDCGYVGTAYTAGWLVLVAGLGIAGFCLRRDHRSAR